MKKQTSNQVPSMNMNNTTHYTLDQCLKLIRSGIKKSGILYKNPFWEEGDLVSVGYLALNNALSTYKEEKEVKFETYVSTCISNAIKDMNNKEGYLIHVPRTKDKEGNYLTAYQTCDLNEWLESGNDLAEENSKIEMLRWMDEVMDESGMTERERMVVEAKYGVGDYELPVSTEVLAKQLGMTTQSVNRICRRAIDKARVS